MSPLLGPQVCPIVVGRDEQLHLIRRLMLLAAAGKGQLLLVSGEAGIGKTRLVGAARVEAKEQGWRLAQGNFFEQDRSLPFGGLVDLLRSDLAAGGRTKAAELAESAPELIALIPELKPAFGLAGRDIDPDGDKRRLFHVFARVLQDLAATKPLLLVLEDLHWADTASLEFLHYLSRLLLQQRILLVLTYRGDETTPDLRHLLAEFERERFINETSLHGLKPSDIDRMLRAMLGRPRPVRTEILQAISSLTDGNPLFVEEIVRSVTSEQGGEAAWDHANSVSAHIPRSVDESVNRRLSSLTPESRRLLEIAAVAGRRFDFQLLQELSGLDESRVLADIKDLVAGNLVVEESAEQFSFQHALTRQAVYEGLLQRERRQIHARIAETMKRLYEASLDEHSADLAYHAVQAEDWPAALDYSRRAGERALLLYSPASAAEHFQRGLIAAAHLAETRLGQIYTGLGKAHEILGEFEAARADYENALSEGYGAGDTDLQWQSLLNLGMLWAGQDYERAGGYYDQATSLAQGLGDRNLLAHSLNRVGNWLANNERPWEGLECHREALAIFEEAGDLAAVAGTLDLLGMASLSAGDLPQSYLYYLRAMDLFRDLNNKIGLTSSLATLTSHGGAYHSDASVAALTLAAARGYSLQGLALARQIGWRSAESYANWNLGLCEGPAGDYGAAIEHSSIGLEIATEIEHTQWRTAAHLTVGSVFLDLLDLQAARLHTQRAVELAQETGSQFWLKLCTSALALVEVAAGELDAAQSHLLPLRSSGTAMTLAGRQVECAWCELLLARGLFNEALLQLQVMESTAAGFSEQGPVARISYLLGRAFLGLNRLEESEQAFSQALAAAERDGRRSLVWRLHAELVRLCVMQANADAAEAEVAAAVRMINELATTIPQAALQAQFIDAALTHLPEAGKKRARTGLSGKLSRREREIASLIALGYSNRGMADRLVLSERTVETHVANALSKLGFSSRSQLAVWAVENGLTTSNSGGDAT